MSPGGRRATEVRGAGLVQGVALDNFASHTSSAWQFVQQSGLQFVEFPSPRINPFVVCVEFAAGGIQLAQSCKAGKMGPWDPGNMNECSDSD